MGQEQTIVETGSGLAPRWRWVRAAIIAAVVVMAAVAVVIGVAVYGNSESSDGDDNAQSLDGGPPATPPPATTNNGAWQENSTSANSSVPCISDADCPDNLQCGYPNFKWLTTPTGNVSNTTNQVCCNATMLAGPAHHQQYVCLQPDGASCGGELSMDDDDDDDPPWIKYAVMDQVCAGGACYNDICMDPGEHMHVCDSANDCVHGTTCAHEVIDGTDRFVCCQVVFVDNGNVTRCADRRSGLNCRYNMRDYDIACASHICVNGVCVDPPVVGEACGHDAHCPNDSACATYFCEFAYNIGPPGNRLDCVPDQTTCCPSAATVTVDDGTVYCSDLPADTSCGDDLHAICASGACWDRHCLADTFALGTTCRANAHCQSGACGATDTVYLNENWICCEQVVTFEPNYNDWQYCSNRPSGTYCGSHGEICGSNVCDTTTGTCA